jgi:hypothetical protein
MKISAVPAAAAALVLSLSATACLERRSTAPRELGGLDRKLSTFAWIEDGNLVALIVDTRAARYTEDAPYVPLEIAVANRGLANLTLTRESFTLVDETGQRYGAVGPRELMEGYDFLDRDRTTLAELAEIVEGKFATFTAYPSRFSPSRALTRGSNLVRDSVTLPKFGYMVDFIYFPRPATGVLDHRFELQMNAPELPPDNNPIFVKFMVL